MLPSLIAREIKAELENFLASSFPVSTAGFKGEDDTGLIEQFLHDPAKTDNLLKGPWKSSCHFAPHPVPQSRR